MSASNVPVRFRSLMLSLIMFASVFAGMAALTPTVDADSGRSTGNEELVVSVPNTYYDRGSDIPLTIVATNLDSGTEYTLTYTLCNFESMGNGNIDDQWCHPMEDWTNNDEPIVSGTVDIGSGNNYHMTTVSITDPGCCGEQEWDSTLERDVIDGIANGSYGFMVSLDVQDVYLTENMTNGFVLGGEVESSSINYDHENILLNMVSEGNMEWSFDYHMANQYILDYTTNCGLYNSSTNALEDSDSDTWNDGHDFIDGRWYDLQPTTAGDHYVECTLHRDVDSALMGTETGATFTVIDADITGDEEVVVSADSTYYDRGSTIELAIDVSDLFVGTEYTLTYTLCNFESMGNGNIDDQWCYPIEDWTNNDEPIIEDEVTIQATTSTHTETVSITDPGCCGEQEWDSTLERDVIDGIANGSYGFMVSLDVQDVYLTENMTNGFVLGGEVEPSSINYDHENILLSMVSEGNMEWSFDYHNQYILGYTTYCGLYNSSTNALEDSDSDTWNEGHDFIDGRWYDLQPTTGGDHYVECTLHRDIDSVLMATATGDTFSVIDDTSNQDDATIHVSHVVDSVENWATVTITASDLDPGQGYSVEWIVNDNSPVTGLGVMNDATETWVAGSSGSEVIVIEFRYLDDTVDACLSLTFYAGETELDSQTNAACWDQHSTSDQDGDGVYDPADECPGTPQGTSNVQPNGCKDSDFDGWDDSDEIACDLLNEGWNSDPTKMPVDTDNDELCNSLDDDDDGDGYLDSVELASGTDHLDANDYPANQLPICSIHYTLEVDGIPTGPMTGEAVIPTLVAAASTAAATTSGNTPEITIPAGKYYLIAVCIDPDNDPTTVTVNGITVGPMTGEVKAGALIEIGSDVEESIDVTISWDDGINTASATVIVNLDGDAQVPSSSGGIPGFTAILGLVAMLGAAIAVRAKVE